MIKAVFFDIDGTLVSFKTHSVPQSTVNALSEIKKRGIKVFVATGRPLIQIDNLDGLEFDGYITLNGAYCLTGQNEVIRKNAIPMEDIDALIRYQEEKEQFPCTFMTEDEVTVNYVDEKVVELAQMVNVPVPPVKSLREAAKNEVLQIDIYVDKEKERDIMRTVLTHCHASRWNPMFADINLRGSNKQTGMDVILEYHNIRLSDTMAFGDGGNDIPMLRHAATGIAMGNASNEVKRVADYVTDSVDENGIRNALRLFKVIE